MVLKYKTLKFSLVALAVSLFFVTASSFASAAGSSSPSFQTGDTNTAKYQCGSGKAAVKTSFNFGCKGATCKAANGQDCGPITDIVFAVIRFLSNGIGLIMIGSFIVAGIQYTTSRGDPQATAGALNRIRANVGALFLYIFAYAILNFLIPKGFFQ